MRKHVSYESYVVLHKNAFKPAASLLDSYEDHFFFCSIVISKWCVPQLETVSLKLETPP